MSDKGAGEIPNGACRHYTRKCQALSAIPCKPYHRVGRGMHLIAGIFVQRSLVVSRLPPPKLALRLPSGTLLLIDCC